MSSLWSRIYSKIKRIWTVNPESMPYIPKQTRRAPPSIRQYASLGPPRLPDGEVDRRFNIAYFPRNPAAAPNPEIIIDNKLKETIKGGQPEGIPAEDLIGPAHLPRPVWMSEEGAAEILEFAEKNKIPVTFGRRYDPKGCAKFVNED